MRIVYFIDHLRPDGTQRVLTQLVNGLAERHHQQAVVCLNDSWDGEVLDKLRAACCDVRMVGKAAVASGVGLVSTWNWLRQQKFDVAVTLLYASDVLGRPLARLARVPRVITYIQARNSNYSSLQRYLVSSTMNLADRIVVCSQYLIDYVVGVEGVPEWKLRVIPHGIHMEDALPPMNGNGLRSELKLPEGSMLVGSLGRLTYQKGYDVLLEAFAEIQRDDVHLLVAGDGEELQSLQSLAQLLGLNGRVHLLGYRREVAEFLSTLDVYVQPSRFEGMPNAVLEAMRAGCSIVASAVDGICELIEDSVTGWMVPAEDRDALSQAICDAMADREEAQRRATLARQRVIDEYSLERMVERWENILVGIDE